MKKNKIFLSMNFSYPFLIKFYYFYSAIVALKFKLSRKRSRIRQTIVTLILFVRYFVRLKSFSVCKKLSFELLYKNAKIQ
jgi:hypothetical protein